MCVFFCFRFCQVLCSALGDIVEAIICLGLGQHTAYNAGVQLQVFFFFFLVFPLSLGMGKGVGGIALFIWYHWWWKSIAWAEIPILKRAEGRQ
jgi:hypothetical protein